MAPLLVCGRGSDNRDDTWRMADVTYNRSWRAHTLRYGIDADLDVYDEHNGNSRLSNDRNERMYGKCGCGECGRVRKQWQQQPTALDRRKEGDARNMASINLCERKGCKSMIQGRAVGLLSLVTTSDDDAERLSIELCPGCVGDIVMTIETDPVTAREGAYREGWQRPRTTRGVGELNGVDTEALLAEVLTRHINTQKSIEG